MNFEASTRSSRSATNPCTTDDHNKRGGRNSKRHPVSEARDPGKGKGKGKGKRSRICSLDTSPNPKMGARELVTPLSNSNSVMLEKENAGGLAEFVDEEAMFNMPLLVDCMAEGMLLTPPAFKKGFNWTQHDQPHHNFDFTLWHHHH